MISIPRRRLSAVLCAVFLFVLLPGPAFPQSASPGAPAGDPVSGKALFTGARRFDNGGAQCLACHTAGGVGLFGGGALGPDLTNAGAKYGPGLASLLARVPFPTMKPVYKDRPLTKTEAADLSAFIRQGAGAVTSASFLLIITLSIDGLAGLYVLFSLLWRGRLKRVRESLMPR